MKNLKKKRKKKNSLSQKIVRICFYSVLTLLDFYTLAHMKFFVLNF